MSRGGPLMRWVGVLVLLLLPLTSAAVLTGAMADGLGEAQECLEAPHEPVVEGDQPDVAADVAAATAGPDGPAEAAPPPVRPAPGAGQPTCAASPTDTHNRPQVGIGLSPGSGSGPVGVNAEWVATVTADGSPAAGELVRFTATMPGAPTVTLQAETTADGTARFAHSQDLPGIDSITVEVSAYEQSRTAQASYTWVQPQAIEVLLSLSDSSGEVGTDLTWTATVLEDAVGVEGASVRFLGELAGEPDVDVTLPTDAGGVVSHTHTRQTAGTETLTVVATWGADTATATASFGWEEVTVEPVTQLQIEPQDGSALVGETTQFTATFTQDGQPLAGEVLYFLATQEGSSDTVFLEEVTGEDGTATFTHSRDTAGVDHIVVDGFVSGQEVVAETTFTWHPVGVGVRISPMDSSATVGETVEFRATVTDDGEPLAGEPVVLRATLQGTTDTVTLQEVTDEDGVARFEHSRGVAGVDLIEAEATGSEALAETTFTWVSAGPVVDISPADSVGQVGETVGFQAIVTQDGVPLSGEQVYFSAVLDGDYFWADGFTDEDGTATFEHTRDVPGVDTIEVSTYPSGAYAQTTFTWVPSGQAVQIWPVDSRGLVGDTVEFVATVTDDGAPVTGAVVAFRALLDGVDDPVDLEATTGADGRAIFAHTRDVPGIDTITVATSVFGAEAVAETTFIWDPPGLAVRVSPLDSSAQLGETVEFQATVTQDSELVIGALVYFTAVLEETGSEVFLDAVTGEDGVARFEHSRNVAGLDLVTVGLPETQVFAETTFTWRGPLQVTLEAGTGSGEVGTPVELTATVSGDVVALAWVEGVEVRFLAQLPGEPDVDVTLTTDASGVATYTHTRSVPGAEAIEVTATLGDETATDSGTFLWFEPPPVMEIGVEPLNSSGPVGGPVEFAATVTEDGQPRAGENVWFYATLVGTEDTVFMEGATDADGVARFEHSRSVLGVESITVEASPLEQFIFAETTFTWREPLEVSLSAGEGSGEVGSPLVWAATVTSAGQGMEGASVRFLGQMTGQPDVDVTLTTDATGVATHTHTRTVPGTESLLIEATVGVETVTATGSFVWEEPPPVVQLAIEPVDASGPAGEPVEFVATLTADGEPLTGEVLFTAMMDGAPQVFLDGVTGVDGTVTFEHGRDVLGVDTITVEAVALDQEVSAETTFTWEEPPPVITLTQSASSGDVGSPLEWSATLTSGGEAVVGTGVRFFAQLSGATDLDVTVPTNSDGVATYTHTRSVPGTESLLVGATVGDETVFAAGSFEWVVPPTPVVQIAIQPTGASGPVDDPVDFLATVTADDEPLAGQSVTFTATMTGAPAVSLTAVTDANGIARVTHTRTVAGVDTITVQSVAFEQAVQADTTFTWTSAQPPAVLTLSQSGTSGQVGTPLTWTATLTAGGEPVPGASVRFLGQLAGQADVDVTLTTDADGTATHAHTRSAPGTESLQVTATVDGQNLLATGSFAWQTTTTPAPVLELDLVPGSSSGPVASSASWTATVTLDGAPVSGAAVDFHGVLPGQPDVLDAGVLTDGAGQATHTHLRVVSGTETLTATTEVDGLIATAVAERTWTPGPTGPPTTPEPPDVSIPPTTPPITPPTTPPTSPPEEPPAVTEPEEGPEGPTEDDNDPAPPPPTSDPAPPPLGAGTPTAVLLGRESAIPGGDLEVSGSGCEPGSTVVVTLAGETMATTVADSTGAFSVRAAVANVPLGQYAVDVQCGEARGEAVVDLVSTVESSTAVASAASAAAVLTFFVLLGASVLKETTGAAG